MAFRTLAVISLLALAAGCSGGSEENAAANAAGNEAVTASGEPVPSEEALASAVDCTARMEAVSNLYRAMASQKVDEEQVELSQTAEDRAATGASYRRQAIAYGERRGLGEAQVERMLIAANGQIEQESERRPFEEFASWLGSQADRCPPPTIL